MSHQREQCGAVSAQERLALGAMTMLDDVELGQVTSDENARMLGGVLGAEDRAHRLLTSVATVLVSLKLGMHLGRLTILQLCEGARVPRLQLCTLGVALPSLLYQLLCERGDQ
jgi:hypothetical protein